METPRASIKCSLCQEHKPESEWMPSAWKRGNGYCRDCQREYYAKQKSGKGRSRLYEYTKARRNARRELVMAIKAERGCMYCDEKHPAALDLHHRDKEEKVESVAHMVDKVRTEETILAEIAKCDVVCANCHRKLHYAAGGVSFWKKEVRHHRTVVEEAEEIRQRRNAKYPVVLRLA